MPGWSPVVPWAWNLLILGTLSFMFSRFVPVRRLSAMRVPSIMNISSRLGMRRRRRCALLSSHKGNIAHHLKVFREAGLVTPAGTRQVRGGTEQYYQRAARILHFAGEHSAASTVV